MKKWGDIIKNMTLLSQFSLSFITPLLLCLLICWWMSTSLGQHHKLKKKMERNLFAGSFHCVKI